MPQKHKIGLLFQKKLLFLPHKKNKEYELFTSDSGCCVIGAA